MTRPYSSDLRERVVASVGGGRSCRATAELFGVSGASVVRWSQRQRATGSSGAKPMGGRRRLPLLPQREWLLARIAAAPDLTVRALRAELVERGVKISYGAVWSFLAAERLTFKKNSARRRAGAGRCRSQARPLEAISGAG
jgi:transposase